MRMQQLQIEFVDELTNILAAIVNLYWSANFRLTCLVRIMIYTEPIHCWLEMKVQKDARRPQFSNERYNLHEIAGRSILFTIQSEKDNNFTLIILEAK